MLVPVTFLNHCKFPVQTHCLWLKWKANDVIGIKFRGWPKHATTPFSVKFCIICKEF